MPMLKAMNLVTQARRRRRSARRPVAVGPQSVPGAVARTRAVRHLGIRPRLRPADDRRVAAKRRRRRSSRELNQAFPALDLTLADVTLVHRGVVPAVAVAATARRARGPRTDSRSRDGRGRRARQRRRHEVHDRARGRRARDRSRRCEAAAAAGAVPHRDDAAARRQRPRRRARHRRSAPRARRRPAERHDSASVGAVRIALSRRAGAGRRTARLAPRVADDIAGDRRGARLGGAARDGAHARAMRSSGGRRSARSAIRATTRVERAAAIVGAELGWSRRETGPRSRGFDRPTVRASDCLSGAYGIVNALKT